MRRSLFDLFDPKLEGVRGVLLAIGDLGVGSLDLDLVGSALRLAFAWLGDLPEKLLVKVLKLAMKHDLGIE